MTMLANTEQKALTITDYEARIYLYKEQIGTGYIGIGRTLNEAKEAKVVPHGQWEQWVTATTGLSIQQAQRCMRAAREIKDGSAMARLEMSKALMLLSSGLDDGEKEDVARAAVEESITVRELQEEITRREKEFKALGDAHAAQSKRLSATSIQMVAVEQRAKAAEDALQASRKENEALKAEAAKQAAGISPEAQQMIDGLKADLAAAERREAKKAEQLEHLRNDRRQRDMDEARGVTVTPMSGFDLAAAVRQFIGAAGVIPQMGSTLQAMGREEKAIIRQNIDTVDAWVRGARAALDSIPGEATVR